MGTFPAFPILLSFTGIAFAAFCVWCWRKRHGWRPMLVLAVLLGLCTWFGKSMMEEATSRDAGRVNEMLAGLAPTLASELGAEGHAQIRSGESSDSRKNVSETVARWRKGNSLISEIYSLRAMPDGRFQFVMRPREGVSDTPSSEYTQGADELKKALTGKGFFSSDPIIQGGQSVIRCIHPILNSSGKPEAILVMTFPTRVWEQIADGSRWAHFTMLMIVLLMTLGGGVMLTELIVSTAKLRISKVELQAQSESITNHMREIAEKNQQMAASQAALGEAYTKLRKMATTDSLTGVMNHRALMESLAIAMQGNTSFGSPCSVILLDVDNFKQLNDQYGHIAGDDALRVMGTVLGQSVPQGAAVGRYGGEEFMIVLPGTSEATATAVAEEVRRRIQLAKTTSRPITVSVGVATCYAGSKSEQSLIDEADQALYVSKRGGKNRVTHFGHGLLEAS